MKKCHDDYFHAYDGIMRACWIIDESITESFAIVRKGKVIIKESREMSETLEKSLWL